MSPDLSGLIRMRAEAGAENLSPQERRVAMGILKRLHLRMRGTRSVIDHAETEEERRGLRRDFFRGPNARTDAWYDSRGDQFVDEGRPRK